MKAAVFSFKNTVLGISLRPLYIFLQYLLKNFEVVIFAQNLIEKVNEDLVLKVSCVKIVPLFESSHMTCVPIFPLFPQITNV